MAEAKSDKRQAILANLYVFVFSIIGIGLAVVLSIKYIQSATFDYNEILQLVVLSIALSLCRSMPLPTRSGQGMDISIIILYASVIIKDINATMLIFLVSMFFTFARWENKKVSHIFNTPIDKTLFNNANYIISVFVGYCVYHAVGGQINHPDDFPNIIWQSLLFLIVTLVVDSINLFTILKLTYNIPYFSSLIKGISGMIPTLLAFAPIGYFIALMFETGKGNGPYLAMLFFVPLLFARYAFKLYIDSKEQYLRTISTLTTAIEAKDEYTEGHSMRVAKYSVEIAQAMKLRSARIDNIKVAAMLHDIGKIGIEDEILRKPTKLNEYEWGKIMEHPTIGIKILEEVVMPDTVKDMILYHHIRYDKKGYPQSGRDMELPMEVHIISLADAYDAMTSDRPYRKALSEDVAMKIIQEERGTQFHPEVVDEFLNMKKSSHTGT